MELVSPVHFVICVTVHRKICQFNNILGTSNKWQERQINKILD
jgi:hypothetical protein